MTKDIVGTCGQILMQNPGGSIEWRDKMTREQFIKRLEEMGFHMNIYKKYVDKTGGLHIISIFSNKDFFTYGHLTDRLCGADQNLYSFDELEQFLIDKGIVEKPFDAHTYLIMRGFVPEDPTATEKQIAYFIPKCKIEVAILIDYTRQSIRVVNFYTWNDIYHFKEITQQSCDKAIALVEFLIKLEQSND